MSGGKDAWRQTAGLVQAPGLEGRERAGLGRVPSAHARRQEACREGRAGRAGLS